MWKAPHELRWGRSYPKHFQNRERLPLKSPSYTREFPILGPGQQWKFGTEPGPTRVLYPPNKNTDHIDVGYHDPRSGHGHGANMTMGVYHSKSTGTGPMEALMESLWRGPSTGTLATHVTTAGASFSGAYAQSGQGRTGESSDSEYRPLS